MTAIFTGPGAGFARSSATVLGSAGLLGSAATGRGGDNVMVNAATGNLVITREDEFLVGLGPDAAISRTYNSLAQVADRDNGDNWQQSTTRRVYGLTGTLNTANSTVSRQGGDGSVIVFTWDAAKSAYLATDGDGAHEKLVKSGATWIWTDGASQVTETYEVSVGDASVYRIKEIADTDLNKVEFRYVIGTDKFELVTTQNHNTPNTATGQAEVSYVLYSWSGNNVTEVITGYTDYAAPFNDADNVNRTLTRTRYGYDGQNRLVSVTVDLTPENNSTADGVAYVTNYTYHGTSNRVATITQTDGSSLAIAYDAQNRVTEIKQAVAGAETRTTRIGYGVNQTSITDPKGEVTRLWYDNKGQLLQVMTPPASKGGPSQVLQYEYDAVGNLLRKIETDSVNASIPDNLVSTAGWGDGEEADRGDNLIDDSGWPQDVDGTLPPNGSAMPGWSGAYLGETAWEVTTGPYGTSVVSMRAGQNDSANGAGGGAQTNFFAIDAKKAYEFTYYFKLNAPAVHPIYFGGPDIWTGQPGYVDYAFNGQNTINPYFYSMDAATQNSLFQVGRWYKVVGYILPENSPSATGLGGVYDTTTGDKVAATEIFRWSTQRVSDQALTRFFNHYGTAVTKNTNFWKPGVQEVADAAILRSGDKLDIVKDRNLIEAPLAPGWQNVPWANSDNEARWNEVVGPDGAWQTALQTGQFDNNENGGGGYTNAFTIDPTKTYRFTQYFRRSDLTRHSLYFGLSESWAPYSPYVKNASNGVEDPNPYFMSWAAAYQQVLQEDRWYKVVGYVLPQGSANITAGSLGGVYDAVTGARLADVPSFRWNENRPNNQVHARFFTYYDQALTGWSTDWLAPEVVLVASATADNAAPFGVVYDPTGLITTYTYDAWGNWLTRTDPNGNVVTRTYGPKNELLTETRTGSDASGPAASLTTRYVYDSENHLRFVVSPEGNVTLFYFDNNGNMHWQVEFPQSQYDLTGLASNVAPSYSQMFDWVYAVAGATSPERKSVKIDYSLFDARGQKTQLRQYGIAEDWAHDSYAEGYQFTYSVYDQAGRLLSLNKDGESAQTFVYDGLGRLKASSDPATGTTTIVFNDAALTTTVTNSTNGTTVSTYNKAGDLIGMLRHGFYDETQSASYLYDKNGRVRVSYDTAGYATYYLYDNAGRKVADIDAYGSMTEYRYDAMGRIVAQASYANYVSSAQLALAGDPYSAVELASIRPAAHAYDVWSWSVYDAGGRLIQTIDGEGGVVAYTYDASDRVVKTVQYYNKLSVAGFATTPPSVLVLPTANSLKDAVTRSFYNRDGRLIGELDGEGYLSEFVYDKAGLKIEEIRYGASVDPSVRATGSFNTLRGYAGPSNPDVRRTRYVYDAQSQLRYTVNSLGYATSFAYNTAGKLTTTIAHAGAISTSNFTYENVKALVAAIANDANDRESYVLYNGAGQAVYTIDAGGKVTGFTYDVGGRLTKSVEYAVARSTPTLPDLGTMISWATSQAGNSANRITRNWYTANGELRFSVDGEGYVKRFDYNGDHRLTREVTWTNAIVVSDATNSGQVNDLANASGTWADVNYSYDAAGRRNSVYDGESNRTVYGWHANGEPGAVYRAYNTADQSLLYWFNDGAGRTRNLYNAHPESEQAVTQYFYDGIGNRTTVVDPNNKTTTYEYDRRGLVTKVIDAASGQTTYEYNAFGEVVKVVDPRLSPTYTYHDTLGRATLVHDAGGYITQTTYTAFGEVDTVTRRYIAVAHTGSTATAPTPSPHGYDAVTNFDYDKRGRVILTTDALGFYESYGYNTFGDRTSQTGKSNTIYITAGGTTTYGYDRRGLMISETLPMSSVGSDGNTNLINGVPATTVTNTYQYDSRGNLKTETKAVGLPEQVTVQFVYDRANRLIEKIGQEYQGYVPHTYYYYDGRGNLTSRIEPGGAKTVYFYDDLDRVVVEINAVGTYTGYSYDPNGNVTAIKVYETPVSLPADGGSQEEALVGPPPLAPPPSGNYRETTFTYDNLNRLLTSKVGENAPAAVTTGSWNGSSWVSSSTALTTQYVYDANGNVVQTIDPNGNTTWAYYDALNRKTHQVQGGSSGYYMTAWIYDAEGNVTRERRYWNNVYPTTVASPPSVGAEDYLDRTTDYTYDRMGNRKSETRYWVYVNDINNPGNQTYAHAQILYDYNGLGQVTRKQEATGEAVDYSYDQAGRLTQETKTSFVDFGGASVVPTTEYRYDGVGHLTRTRQVGNGNAADRVTTYGYWGGNLRWVTDAEGNYGNGYNGKTTYYWYDTAGNVQYEYYTRYDSNNGYAGNSSYDGIFRVYDGLGRVTQQWNLIYPNGSSWTQTGPTTTTAYNTFGEVKSVQVGSGALQQNQYDKAGRLIGSNAGDGVWKYFGYDKNGNQTVAVTSGGGDLTTLNLTSALTYIGQANVNATYTVYDNRNLATQVVEEGRELTTSTAQTLTSTRAYNAFGEVSYEIAANDGRIDYTYNNMGRAIRIESPTVTVVSEAGASSSVRPTEHLYYDAAGRLVAQRDANGNLNRLTLLANTGYGGSQALVTRETHADGGYKDTKYDIHGDARVLIDEMGRQIQQSFDQMGRIEQVINVGSGLTDEYRYDGLGQQLKHWNSLLGSGNAEITNYDAQGRVISQQAFGGDTTTTTYAWDSTIGGFGGWTETRTMANSRVAVEKTDIFGRVHYKDDLDNTLNSGAGHVYGYTYDPAGRLTTMTQGSATQTYAYFNTGKLRSITLANTGGGSTPATTYGYDVMGNLTAQSTYDSSIGQTQTLTAAYDALGRMTSWSESGNATTPAANGAIFYDAKGNVRRVSTTYAILDGFGAATPSYYAQDNWYRYDTMDRMVVSKGYQTGSGIAGGIGIAYNAAGQRTQATNTKRRHDYLGLVNPYDGQTYYSWVDWDANVLDTYSYDGAGRLYQVLSGEGSPIYYYDVNTGQTVLYSSSPGTPTLAAQFNYDAMGRLSLQQDFAAGVTQFSRALTYDTAGRIYVDDSTTRRKDNGDLYRNYTVNTYLTGTSNMLGAANSSATTTYRNGSDSAVPNTSNTNTYVWWDSALQGQLAHYNGSTTYNTYYYYNAFAQLTSVSINDGRPRTVTFKNSADGQAIRRDEADNYSGNGDPHEVHYRFGGKHLGTVGNNGTENVAYTAATEQRTVTPGTGAFRGGATYGASFADFGLDYEGTTSFDQGSQAGLYTVQAGDTLAGIAQGLWGDATLWYKLAEANGLSATGALQVGRSLTIPTGVQRVHNNASTFKPYDPAETIGDTSPTTPKPGKKNKCGVFGQILLAAVAVAVSVLLTPVATGLLAGLSSFGSAVAGGAIAAAAGSVASQAVGMATGIQQKFSFKSVALAAIGGAVGGALKGVDLISGNALGGATKAANDVARGVIGSVANQGIGVATGLQDKFSWAGVAVAGIGAGVGGGVARGLARNAGFFSTQFGNDFASTSAAAISSAATRSAIEGSSFGENLIAALPDAIGSTLGRALGGTALTALAPERDARARIETVPSRTGSQIDGGAEGLFGWNPLRSFGRLLKGLFGGGGRAANVRQEIRRAGQADQSVPETWGGDITVLGEKLNRALNALEYVLREGANQVTRHFDVTVTNPRSGGLDVRVRAFDKVLGVRVNGGINGWQVTGSGTLALVSGSQSMAFSATTSVGPDRTIVAGAMNSNTILGRSSVSGGALVGNGMAVTGRAEMYGQTVGGTVALKVTTDSAGAVAIGNVNDNFAHGMVAVAETSTSSAIVYDGYARSSGGAISLSHGSATVSLSGVDVRVDGGGPASTADTARGGVYVLMDGDRVVRTGRTNDFNRRRAEHARDPLLKNFDFVREYETDSYIEQRGLEQYIHEKYGYPEFDRINPISPHNRNVELYQRAAWDYLMERGRY